MVIALYIVDKRRVAVIRKGVLDSLPGMLAMLCFIGENGYRFKTLFYELTVYIYVSV